MFKWNDPFLYVSFSTKLIHTSSEMLRNKQLFTKPPTVIQKCCNYFILLICAIYIWNMGAKSSTQLVRFLNRGLPIAFMMFVHVKFFFIQMWQSCRKGDWNCKISRNLRNLGCFENINRFFSRTKAWFFSKITKGGKFAKTAYQVVWFLKNVFSAINLRIL